MVRLEPMDDADFEAFVERAIPRRAAKWVERGIWSEATALDTSRQQYRKVFPNGRNTPGRHVFNVLDSTTGTVVGELWYSTEEQGGKVQFWLEWIQIEPGHRRKGFATEAIHAVEEIARGLGADRIGLTVWTDNPGAQRLYSKLGYTPANVNMTKILTVGGTRP